MADLTFLADFAETLLLVAGNGMVASGCDPIGHAYTTIGDPVLDETVCCPGLLAVSWGPLGASTSFPVPMNIEPLNCVPPTGMVTYTITVARCWPPMQEGGQPPPDQDLVDAAAGLGLDQYAIWRAVVCYLLAQNDADGVSSVIGEAIANDPEGNCVTVTMDVTIGFDDPCFCEEAELLQPVELLRALFGENAE